MLLFLGVLYVQNVWYYLWHAGCSEVHLTDQSHGTVNATRCADGKLASSSFISDGVVCYNGTTAGSVAVYTCNNGFLLVGNEVRVCMNEGNWNGSIPQCIPIPQEPGMYSLSS